MAPPTLGHQRGDVVRRLSRRLDHDHHASELGPRQLVVDDVRAEHGAVAGVVEGGVVGGLHHADRPRRRLQPTVLETLHLVVEATAEAVALADQVLRRHPPVLEGHLVAVHAAVADRVDRAPFHPADTVTDGVLAELEAVPVGARLGDDEEAQPSVCFGAVGIGAGEQHQHVGPRGERAPGLHPVDDVARRAVDAIGWCRRHLEPGDIAPEVGLGHRDRHHHLATRQLRQPMLLLRLGTAPDEGAGEDLRAGDQRPADPEAGAAQLLSGDDHREVLAVAALGEPAVLRRDRQPEGAELGKTGDDVLGDVAVGAMDVLGVRGDDVGGERAKCVTHHVHVVVEVERPRRLGQRGDELGIAVALEGRQHGVERPEIGAPELLPPGDPRQQVVDDVGRESAGNRRFGVALRPVVEHHAGSRRCCGGVGEVVGEDLGDVGPTGAAQRIGARRDRRVGAVDEFARRREVGTRHPPKSTHG